MLQGNEIGKMSLKSLESLIEEEEEKKRLNRLRNFDCSSQFQGTFTCLAVVRNFDISFHLTCFT